MLMLKDAAADPTAMVNGAYHVDPASRELSEEEHWGLAQSKQRQTQALRLHTESQDAQFWAPAPFAKGKAFGIQALDHLATGEFAAAERAFLEAQRCFAQAYEEAAAARAGATQHIEQLQRAIAARKQEAMEEHAPSLASPLFAQGVACVEHAQQCVEGQAWRQALEAYQQGMAAFTEAREAARHETVHAVEAAQKDAVVERERARKLHCAALFAASVAKAEASFTLAVDTFERGQSPSEFTQAQTLFQESSAFFRFLCTRAWEERAAQAKAQAEEVAAQLLPKRGEFAQYVQNSLADAEQPFQQHQFAEACARYENLIATLEALPHKPQRADALPKVLQYSGVTLGLGLVLFLLFQRHNPTQLPTDSHSPILSPSDVGPHSSSAPQELFPPILQTIEETVEGRAVTLTFVIPGIHQAVLIRPESAAVEKQEALSVTNKGRFEVTLADLPPGSTTARLLLSRTAARTPDYAIVLNVHSSPGKEIQRFEDHQGAVTAEKEIVLMLPEEEQSTQNIHDASSPLP